MEESHKLPKQGKRLGKQVREDQHTTRERLPLQMEQKINMCIRKTYRFGFLMVVGGLVVHNITEKPRLLVSKNLNKFFIKG